MGGGTAYAGPHENAPVDFDGEYALRVRDEVAAHGGADAPDQGVDATLTDPDASDEADCTFTVTRHEDECRLGVIAIRPGMCGPLNGTRRIALPPACTG
ncbi:hypothetical protein [Streptomyces sp. NPDC018347]|uniref:hypothetical protein n=1 Tax=Streptomyces sp. NPDC018347 TaxID=3157193 RepID=UPI0034108773